MAPKNTLRDGSIPREEVSGEKFTNVRMQKVMKVPRLNGETEEVVTEASESVPGEDGTYVEKTVTNFALDKAGNILRDTDDLVAISWSGLFIKTQEQLAICSSWFHPFNLSRNILRDQDGHDTNRNGHAICTGCQNRKNIFYLAAAIVAVCVVIGIFKGTYSVAF